MEKKLKKGPPYDFVLEAIDDLHPTVKPMFGGYGVYVESKIVFILWKKEKDTRDNGVWLATTSEHHGSLKKDFPNMHSHHVFGTRPTGWQVLPETEEDFEESVLHACKLVRKADPRIGKIPKSAQVKSKTKSKNKKGPVKRSPSKKAKKKKS